MRPFIFAQNPAERIFGDGVLVTGVGVRTESAGALGALSGWVEVSRAATDVKVTHLPASD